MVSDRRAPRGKAPSADSTSRPDESGAIGSTGATRRTHPPKRGARAGATKRSGDAATGRGVVRSEGVFREPPGSGYFLKGPLTWNWATEFPWTLLGTTCA